MSVTRSELKMESEYALTDPDDHGLPVDEPEEEEELAPPAPAAAESGAAEWGKQFLLCASLIFITIYEAIFKKKAISDPETKFDPTSLIVMQGIVSITIGTAMAGYFGEAKEMVGEGTFFPKQIARYAPVGLLFSAASYVQFIALAYLATDVFKVLEQSRLIGTAIIARLLMSRKLSVATWTALVSITLVAVSYSIARNMTRDVQTLDDTIAYFQGEAQMVSWAGAEDEARKNLVLKHVKKVLTNPDGKLVEHLVKHVSARSMLDSSTSAVGYILTGLFVCMSCTAGVYSERVLKGSHHMPFYIQKVYLEIPASFSAFLFSWIARPILVSHGIAKDKLETNIIDNGLFCGWGASPWVGTTFFFMIIKSWLSGIICKQLSSLSKQLCSITAVVVLYFVTLIHVCPVPDDPSAMLGGSGAPMWCPSQLGTASFSVIVADLAVLCAVVSYMTAMRDKQRKQMWKKQFVQADEERQVLLAKEP